ncbi:predicted protein [Naegleria gruberi]|uniref:Predicted protein n=1 Tax=Naegleria gruberi TaxID=5762 RepID=D2VX95_NAEGR|nr:uncharacterized protein NAEGRDRAFT_73665 [Naegleria gruberi]EFC38638.1 predicted protein [Naegleria gruberi]|eukprot:XP_002671382.1 predicted protein [Naegleria gruberi strain NEG-M]
MKKANLNTCFDDDELDKLASEISTISSPISSNLLSTPSPKKKRAKTVDTSLLSSPLLSEEEISISTDITSINSYHTREVQSNVSSLKLELQKKKLECERIRREAQMQLAQLEQEKENEKHFLEMEILKFKTQLEQ